MEAVARKPDHRWLFEIASEQQGYFTAEQARAAGFSWALLSHFAKRGRFLRLRRGLYRLRDSPPSPREEVMAAWVAAGKDIAVVSRESALDLLVEGAAVRYRVVVALAGRPFEQVTVDVGFGGPPPLATETLLGPDLLAFAGIAPLAIPALPLEQHVAEKLHAYTRRYGERRQNTRVKDLVDLVLIQASASFEAGRLRAALVATFADRALQPLPSAVPPPPDDWGAVYRRMTLEVGLEPELSAGHRAAAAFLDPLLAGAVDDRARWAAAAGLWLPETV